MDEEGNDPYPAPKSGMADRGRQIYAANGCVYCHSQQVRADYAASDIERTRDPVQSKWGERRSAPRDYIFERPVLLGKMRLGPDLANIGKGAPAEKEKTAPASGPTTQPAAPAANSAPAASPAKIAAVTPPRSRCCFGRPGHDCSYIRAPRRALRPRPAQPPWSMARRLPTPPPGITFAADASFLIEEMISRHVGIQDKTARTVEVAMMPGGRVGRRRAIGRGGRAVALSGSLRGAGSCVAAGLAAAAAGDVRRTAAALRVKPREPGGSGRCWLSRGAGGWRRVFLLGRRTLSDVRQIRTQPHFAQAEQGVRKDNRAARCDVRPISAFFGDVVDPGR